MSQIATTIEQSKRLLNAGLDPGSADMKHTRLVIKADGEGYFSIYTVEDFHVEVGNARFEDEVPAWSLSRMIDIEVYGSEQGGCCFDDRESSEEMFRYLVDAIIADIKDNNLNYGFIVDSKRPVKVGDIVRYNFVETETIGRVIEIDYPIFYVLVDGEDPDSIDELMPVDFTLIKDCDYDNHRDAPTSGKAQTWVAGDEDSGRVC